MRPQPSRFNTRTATDTLRWHVATERTNDAAATTRARNQGLFRTILAGSGRSCAVGSFSTLTGAPSETYNERGLKCLHAARALLADFSLRCRMRHALALMRDQNWSVAQVSEAVGYSHATSFTTAFRRHFGMRPSDVRRVKSRG
jgi:AraC-like DNA-binding protein